MSALFLHSKALLPSSSRTTSIPSGEIQQPISWSPEAAWRISGRIQGDRSGPA